MMDAIIRSALQACGGAEDTALRSRAADQLLQLNDRSPGSFLLADFSALVEKTGLSPATLRQFLRIVLETTASRPVRGDDEWWLSAQGTQRWQTGDQVLRSAVFETGFPALDSDLLQVGGLRPGTITELYGPSGAGKTYVCLRATARAVASGRSVVYLDATAGFNASTVLSFLTAPRSETGVAPSPSAPSPVPSTPRCRTDESLRALQLIEHHTVVDGEHLLDLLLPLRQTPASAGCRSRPGQGRLVVVDAVGSLVVQEFDLKASGPGSAANIALAAVAGTLPKDQNKLYSLLLLQRLMHSLKALPRTDAVLVVNHGRGADYMPAMGRLWLSAADTRLYMQSVPANAVADSALGAAKSLLLPPTSADVDQPSRPVGSRVPQSFFTLTGGDHSASAASPPTAAAGPRKLKDYRAKADKDSSWKRVVVVTRGAANVGRSVCI